MLCQKSFFIMKLIMWSKVFFIFFIYITNVAGSGIRKPSKSNDFRITPVQDCKIMNPNFMIDLTTEKGLHICGGTLITNLHVLSAAHCEIQYVKLHAIDKEFRDIYYKAHLGLVVGAGAHLIEVKNIFQHPHYDVRSSRNDIAVMSLMSAIRKTVKPVKLPSTFLSSRELPLFCPVGTVMAWGKDHLVCGQVITIPLKECEQEFFKMGKRVVCSQDNNVCYNDSGGPLTCCGDDVQYGIVSQQMECEVGGPTAYTRVDFYLEFIKKHVRYKSSQNRQALPIQSKTLMSILLFSIFVIAVF